MLPVVQDSRNSDNPASTGRWIISDKIREAYESRRDRQTFEFRPLNVGKQISYDDIRLFTSATFSAFWLTDVTLSNADFIRVIISFHVICSGYTVVVLADDNVTFKSTLDRYINDHPEELSGINFIATNVGLPFNGTITTTDYYSTIRGNISLLSTSQFRSLLRADVMFDEKMLIMKDVPCEPFMDSVKQSVRFITDRALIIDEAYNSRGQDVAEHMISRISRN